MKEITVEKAEGIHNKLIEKYGGAKGIRDLGGLEAAVARPFQTFGGEDLYPSPIEKAASILESVIIRHPWLDGNKRTGFMLMAFILAKHRIRITASEDECYAMTITVAEGRSSAAEIGSWIASHSARV